jgi:serine/threonine-protein kinase SRPK3
VLDDCTWAPDPSFLQSNGLYYGHDDGAEELEEYCPGGFHPVHLGDEYAEGRYRIVHKLGFGSYSTVWLARDSQRDRYVALKMLLARFSQKTSEAEISRTLRGSRPDDTGKRYVHVLDDEFFVDGPNGRHICLVSEPAKCEVGTLKDGKLPPLEFVRAVVAQAILGLRYIHSCGVVHGGM